jgi:hypothetical protein
MIVNPDAKRLEYPREQSGLIQIVAAGCRIAARVVVREDQAACVALQGISDN